MHAIMIKRLYKKKSSAPMKCLNGSILKGCLSDLSDLKWSGYCLSDLNMPKNYPKKERKA